MTYLDIKKFYQSIEWQRLRYRALVRDRWHCVMCGVYVRGKGLAHVDHVERLKDAPHRALDITNLQTLCHTCHNSFKKMHEIRAGSGANENGFPLDGSWDNGELSTRGDE